MKIWAKSDARSEARLFQNRSTVSSLWATPSLGWKEEGSSHSYTMPFPWAMTPLILEYPRSIVPVGGPVLCGFKLAVVEEFAPNWVSPRPGGACVPLDQAISLPRSVRRAQFFRGGQWPNRLRMQKYGFWVPIYRNLKGLQRA